MTGSAPQYFIATMVNSREFVVLLDSKVVAGPFATAVEADKAREKLAAEPANS